MEEGRLRIGVTNPRVASTVDYMPDAVAREDSTRHVEYDRTSATQFGLRYVRERLEQFYGARASFRLELNESESIATLDDFPGVSFRAGTKQ